MIRPVGGPAPTPAPARPARAEPAQPSDSVQLGGEKLPLFRFPGWKVLLFQALTLTSLLAPPQSVSAADAVAKIEDARVTEPVKKKPMLDTAREMWDGLADRQSLLHHERQVGDYELRLDAGTTELDLLHKVRADVKDPSASVELGVKLDASAFRAELSDSDPQGDWTFHRGLRSDLSGHYTAARRFEADAQGTADQDTSRFAASARAEAFAGWTRDLGDGRMSVDTSAGVAQDVFGVGPTPYVQASQVFRYDLPLLGDDADGVVKLREGASWDFRAEQLQPSYEAFAGVGRKFEVKGHTLKIEAGVRARGDRHDAFDVAPKVKFGFRW